jgi:hypothetical protein
MISTLEAEAIEPAQDAGPVLRTLPTPADLEAVDIDAPARPLTTTDAHQMYRSYEQAFNAAREASDESAQVVYRLVAQLCSMGMSPADPANVWQPLFTFDNGGRSPTAEDFRGEATAIIAGMVGRVSVTALNPTASLILHDDLLTDLSATRTSRQCMRQSSREADTQGCD